MKETISNLNVKLLENLIKDPTQDYAYAVQIEEYNDLWAEQLQNHERSVIKNIRLIEVLKVFKCLSIWRFKLYYEIFVSLCTRKTIMKSRI